ncbi:MAG: hypothetical protein ACE5IR_23625 [bacterium]
MNLRLSITGDVIDVVLLVWKLVTLKSVDTKAIFTFACCGSLRRNLKTILRLSLSALPPQVSEMTVEP